MFIDRKITCIWTSLKRTSTKERVGDATEEEINFFSGIYIEKRGNLDKFAAMFRVNANLMRRKRPTDGRDFAKKILAGFYTGDVGGIEKKELRNHLRENLQRKVSQLKRTTTKEYAGMSEEDIRAVRRSTTRWVGTWTRSPGRATFPSRS